MISNVCKVNPIGASRAVDQLEPYLNNFYYNNHYGDQIKSKAILNISFKDVAYIFFQPGDLHNLQTIKYNFNTLIVRIGDLHHLNNPILSTIQFLDQVNKFKNKVYLNTNPNLVDYFSLRYNNIYAMPLSEITIASGILDKACSLLSQKNLRKEKVVYIGNRCSPFHPRRSFIVNKLIREPCNVYLEYLNINLNPLDWLEELSRFKTVLAPSLNSQWSHNIFVPHLVGTNIITDLQIRPSYDYYTSSIKDLHSIKYGHSINSISNECINSITSQCISELHRKHIAESAIRTMDNLTTTKERIYSFENDFSDVDKTQDPNYLQLVSANIFELLQETVRVIVIYNIFFVHISSFQIFKFLSTYFSHPRITYVYRKELSIKKNESIIQIFGIDERLEYPILYNLIVENSFFNREMVTPEFSNSNFDIRELKCYNESLITLKEFVDENYLPASFPQKMIQGLRIL